EIDKGEPWMHFFAATRTSRKKVSILVAVYLVSAFPALGQVSADGSRKLTAADYTRAEKFMPYNTGLFVFGDSPKPNWAPDDRFWYRGTTADGDEFVIIDPARGTRSAAFDSAKVASALSSATGASLDAGHLPLTDLDFSAGRQRASFKVGDRDWQCDLQSLKCI